jgi:hypothetical protein
VGVGEEEGWVLGLNRQQNCKGEERIEALRIPDLRADRLGPSGLVHPCNPRYSGGKDQEDHSWRPAPRKKSPSQPINNWAQWHMPVIPATWKA